MLAAVVGRTGYFGCLVLLGVVMLSVSCLAVFGATGAITADRGARVAAAPVPRSDAKPAPEPIEPTAKPEAPARATERAAQGTVPPQPARVGPEGNIAQRLDREAIGGNLKLRALGAAKTTQGDRAVLAIYVRMENIGNAPVRIDPAFFKLIDRQGTRYPISKAIEASLPAIELNP